MTVFSLEAVPLWLLKWYKITAVISFGCVHIKQQIMNKLLY